MARDDVPECVGVPASLRRRLSGPDPDAEQARTISAEGEEPHPILIGEKDEEAPAPVNDCDTEQESDCFTVYITMSDGFLAAVTLFGRSVEAGSLNKMTSQDRVAFAAADEKQMNAILGAGAVRILSHQRRVMRSAGVNLIELLFLE